MLKTKVQNLKSLSHRNLSQVELIFNSNDDLNTLLGENSKNIDKLNEIIDVEISFLEISYSLWEKNIMWN